MSASFRHLGRHIASPESRYYSFLGHVNLKVVDGYDEPRNFSAYAIKRHLLSTKAAFIRQKVERGRNWSIVSRII